MDLHTKRKKALADLLEQDAMGADHKEILCKWSDVADSIISSALESTRRETNYQGKFCVIALGKLGSRELNFSSDIDLLYLCEGNPEEAARFAAKLTAVLNVPFRVDTLLRPFGSQGALVNTVETLERYYEANGKEMERQMLLRARPVAGDQEIGHELLKRLTPFIFRRSFDLASLKNVRALKLALEKESSKISGDNIKLGWGGIREAEFVVHSLIILNGGKNASLRTGNVFEGLDALCKGKILSKGSYEELLKGYTLLRRTENILQGIDDRQTHLLPKDGEQLTALSKRLGFVSVEKFIGELLYARRSIQRHFRNLFEASYDKMEIEEAFQANLETCNSLEETIDSIPWFRRYISKGIEQADLDGKISIDDVSEKLTLLAETIIDRALQLSEKKLRDAGKEPPPAADGIVPRLCILGMGKLGSREMDYASDLDIIFIFEGDDCQEYFTKIAQSVLSIISLPTRYGKAYNIDAELRPSGNQGTLITALHSFERYHRMDSSLWERQALLRARPVAGDANLGRRLTKIIEDLVYLCDLPPKKELAKQINDLRQKIVSANKRDDSIDLKKGAGTIADIESIAQFHQLLLGRTDEKIRRLSTEGAIIRAEELGAISKDDRIGLVDGLKLFRTVLARTRLLGKSARNEINPCSELFASVAASLGFDQKEALLGKIKEQQKTVMKIKCHPEP